MVDRDPAFLWETEALRTSGPSRAPVGPQVTGEPTADGGWVTLRRAHEATGIPIGTLRSWARRESVPSHLEETPSGSRRMVSLEEIRRRAEELGRATRRGRGEPSPREPRVVEPDRPLPGEMETAPPPGTMIVPIAAWDRMLIQLGNLHEAGQQLAEAKERAARAETEAMFLRERIAELRHRLEDAPPASSTENEAGSSPDPGEGSPPGRLTVAFWRMMARRLIRD